MNEKTAIAKKLLNRTTYFMNIQTSVQNFTENLVKNSYF